MFPWILVIMVVILILFAIFNIGALYGLSDCDSIKDWIKEEYSLCKKVNQETKAEKAFIKANPLCEKCQKKGIYKKATRMWTGDGKPIPLCDNCYVETKENL